MKIIPLIKFKKFHYDNYSMSHVINTNFGETKEDLEKYYKHLKLKGFKPSEIGIASHRGLYEVGIKKSPRTLKILRKLPFGAI
jgi:hypothetical protein